MKIEIKNISLKSIILSAFPLLVFAYYLVNYIMQVSATPNSTLVDSIVQVILYALTDTMIALLFIMFAAFVYNLFCSFGIKGVSFTLEEPEVQEETKEVEQK